ncbi:conserved hypothetical protein [Paraburkholderia tropica]|nr:conserved hypothetical protein [Paraburkholderia tropica]
MFNEPGRGAPGPRQCPHCGNRLNAPLIFCPQCGANQLAGASRGGEGGTPERPRVVSQRFHTERGAVPAGFGRERFYADYDGYRAHESHGARRSRLPLYAFGAVALVAAALAGYVISHRDAPAGAMIGQSVEGAVSSQQDGTRAPSATTATVHAAPLAGPAPAHRDATARAVPSVAAVPTQSAHAAPTPRNGAVDARASADQSAEKNGGTATRADVARNLAVARTNLDKNRLWPARRAITSALAAQPGNAEAQQMKADLQAREQERDALLGYGRLCAREGKWSCAWQNAGHAVTIDASSQEAKRLLARSIAAQGVGTAGHIDSGSPGPDDDQ